MIEFKQGDWLEVKGEEDGEVFKYVGQVINCKKGVTLATTSGTMFFPEGDDIILKHIKQPKDSVKVEPIVEHQAPVNTHMSTKMQQCIQLIINNPALSRKQYVDLIVQELGMTVAGASTYYNTARKLVS